MQISKAEQERRKSRRSAIEARVLPKLISFHNYYIESYLNWCLFQIQTKADRFSFKTWEEMKDAMVNKPYIDFGFPAEKKEYREVRTRFTHNEVWSLWQEISINRSKLKNKTLTSMKIMNEAEGNYQSKIDGMVEKMIILDFSPNWLKLKDISINKGQLEILIGEDEKYVENSTLEFHARSIWVEGDIKAPHYRFITTTRGEKGSNYLGSIYK